MKNGLQGEIMEKNKRENMSNVFYFLGRILTNKLVIALIITDSACKTEGKAFSVNKAVGA